MSNVVKPPHSIVGFGSQNPISIFLGGSIDMGKAENWQHKVEQHFKSLDLYVLYNPRRDDWDPTWKQEYENAQFYQQVNWELNALEKADIVFIYFGAESKAPISLLELGLHAKDKKIYVVCPKEFYRSGNVEIVCERYGIPLFRNLEDLLELY